ncbi:PTS transporter subunit EIIA [Puniceicoccales bacterium CK1056]|uniref:PTS transporter subunit EIIA n=1 Tax=Oceanipulchritudo coccoides TaxID=2706888 RepID=A0A6B2M2L6_9BACT|nr:PTS sugar transporter subunit IIA [Oceanipulchritudo coccoides]NDV62045.1 PTS transporter subunit EIIA [Oceanipulchritudo coccoides]
MRLDKYIAKSRIIEIESTDLMGALLELMEVSTARLQDGLNVRKITNQLMAREKTMTTYLGNGVAMPHIRVKMKRPYIFAIGRVKDGIEFEGLHEYNEVRLLFLLLASENEKNYLNVLASLARLFRDRDLVDNMITAPDTKTFAERVFLGFSGLLAKPERRQTRFNRLLLKESEKIARESKCSAILLFSDTFAGGIEGARGFPNFRTVLVTRAASDRAQESGQIETAIEVRSFSSQRLSQARSAILIGLTRGIFKHNDRLLCVGGIPSSNQLDTLMVIDIEREFQSVIDRENDLLPPSVKIEVLERMIGIATELSVEGREGKPVGTMFVIGDTEKVNSMVKPLVLNPFYGYRMEDRNVLNPFMDETIKEYSVIDGGFVIRGDGIIESAGSLIHAPAEFYHNLPSGFGTRHSAAAAVTKAADCISLCVSASSGQVTLFRKGVMFPLLEKPIGTSS